MSDIQIIPKDLEIDIKTLFGSNIEELINKIILEATEKLESEKK